jgi:hypothetical protein
LLSHEQTIEAETEADEASAKRGLHSGYPSGHAGNYQEKRIEVPIHEKVR